MFLVIRPGILQIVEVRVSGGVSKDVFPYEENWVVGTDGVFDVEGCDEEKDCVSSF